MFGDIYYKSSIMSTTKIYLVSNIDNNPNKVYVGKTRYKSRESQHRINFGQCIEFSFIDEVDSIDRKYWKPLECFWIEQFRQWGFEIVNKNAGGGGPEVHSEESRSKMSKSRLGRSQNSEWVSKRKLNYTGVSLTKMNCQFCNKELGGKGNLNKHEATCISNPDKQEPKPKSEKWLQAIKKPRNKQNYKKTEEWKQNHSKTMQELYKPKHT